MPKKMTANAHWHDDEDTDGSGAWRPIRLANTADGSLCIEMHATCPIGPDCSFESSERVAYGGLGLPLADLSLVLETSRFRCAKRSVSAAWRLRYWALPSTPAQATD